MIPKKTNTGLAATKKNIQRIRRQLHDAFVFVRSREVTQAISNVSFNELVATAIKELVGDDGAGKRDTIELFDGNKLLKMAVVKPKIHGRHVTTQLDRINAIENTIAGLITQLKSIDPAALEEALADRDDPDSSSRYSSSRRF